MSNYGDKLKEFLDDPQVKELSKELQDFTAAEYAKFDAIVFVGKGVGGLVRAHYCYSKKGFFKVEIDPTVYRDAEFASSIVSAAVNDALAQYNVEYQKVQKVILEKETQLYNKMISLAYGHSGVSEQPTVSTDFNITKKKTYLN